MPDGAGPGGGVLFSTVGRNGDDAGIPFAGALGALDVLAGGLGALAPVFERIAPTTRTTATAAITPATHGHAFRERL